MTANTFPVSAGRALEILDAAWTAQRGGQLTAAYLLHGRPGIGKSEIVRDLARRHGARLFDLRLTTIEPADLRGLPAHDHDGGRTVWLPPEDLPRPGDGPAILFLDELTAAHPTLQPTVYGLLQERRIGRYELPPDTFLVAAGNGIEDGAIAYEIGTALSDRLVHLLVRAEASDWLASYALPQGLHPAVIAFIRTRPDLLETTETAIREGRLIACTPRSWARVSAILRAVPQPALREALIAGTIGEGPAAEFALVAADIAATVRVAEMIAARGRARTELYPASLHGLAALTYALVAEADGSTMPEAIAILAGLRNLARDRPEKVFAAMPLGELATHGFELLIARALKSGWEQAFVASPDYAAYLAERGAG